MNYRGDFRVLNKTKQHVWGATFKFWAILKRKLLKIPYDAFLIKPIFDSVPLL